MGLIAEKKKRAAILVTVFLLGLIILDQAVELGGNFLLEKGYWSDQLIPSMIRAENVDVYIIGTCRASLHMDSEILARETGLKFFNAGKAVDALGNIIFALDVLISQKKSGKLVIVVDDGSFGQSKDVIKNEIEKRQLWWSFLDINRQLDLAQTYGINPLKIVSGFWRYRGQGSELRLAFKQWLKGTKPPGGDGYSPRNADQNVVANIASGVVSEKNRMKELEVNPFAVEQLDKAIKNAIQNDFEPILVTVPMHRFRGEESVNLAQEQILQNLADKYGIKYMNYLGNETEIAQDDILWSDHGHMNQLGAEEFSRLFAADFIKDIEKQNKGEKGP